MIIAMSREQIPTRREGIVAVVVALLIAGFALLRSQPSASFPTWPGASGGSSAGRRVFQPESALTLPQTDAVVEPAAGLAISGGSPAPLVERGPQDQEASRPAADGDPRNALTSTLSQAHRSINEAITPVAVSAPDPGASAPVAARPSVDQAANSALATIAALRAAAAAGSSPSGGTSARIRQAPAKVRAHAPGAIF